ncbi:hypothetical protein ACFL6I_09515 [candidate division KSB1 bacterium]
MEPTQIAIDDLVRNGIKEAEKSGTYMHKIGIHECGEDIFCVAISISNRNDLPGIEDFFYHVCRNGEIIERYQEGYPDSQYQEDEPQVCPGCKTNFTEICNKKPKTDDTLKYDKYIVSWKQKALEGTDCDNQMRCTIVLSPVEPTPAILEKNGIYLITSCYSTLSCSEECSGTSYGDFKAERYTEKRAKEIGISEKGHEKKKLIMKSL